MLSNQVLHKTVQSISKVTGLTCSIWDMQGNVLVADREKEKREEEAVAGFLKDVDNGMEEKAEQDMGLFLVCDDGEPLYILVVRGKESRIPIAGGLGRENLESLIAAYKERMDRNRFMQSLILDNMLLVDIYNQAKKMHIPPEQRRAVFTIEAKKEGENLVQIGRAHV